MRDRTDGESVLSEILNIRIGCVHMTLQNLERWFGLVDEFYNRRDKRMRN
jgi:hypothetical protein